MVQIIYWILAVLVMLVLLISVVMSFISKIKSDKMWKEIQIKELEHINKLLNESEDK